MNNLNSILIEGNLVKDPLLKTTPKGTQVCTMKFASNRYYKLDDQSSDFEKETNFFDVETWGKLAEACGAKGKKGRGLRVVGRLKQNRWNDAEGKSHSRITIVAEHVEFRPEFKREGKNASVSGVPFDDELAAEENDESAMAMEVQEKELAAVTF